MLKKIINKIIMGTKCYLALRKHTNEVEALLGQRVCDLDVAQKQLRENKTSARKIVRLLNANFDKKNGTTKQIKELCNQIIKGE